MGLVTFIPGEIIFHYMVGLFNCMLLEPEDFSKKVAR